MPELKPKTDLIAFLEERGHQLHREGKSFKTLCPFHKDKTPSMSVDPEKNLWHCFGCDRGGDAITYLELAEGLTFGQAADRLHGESLPPIRIRPINPLELMERAAEIYHSNLARHEPALAYLAQRGLVQKELFRDFRLGYADGEQLARLAGNDQQRQALQELGLLNVKGNETLYGCLVAPLKDSEGRVRGFLGRRLQPDKNPHRTLAGPVTGLFHPEAARGSSTIILVEGFLDALACYQAGFRNVMALGGSQAHPLLLSHLQTCGVRQVLLALDPDEAGDRGSTLLAEELEKRGLGSKRVQLPRDPADFFLHGGSGLDFRRLLEEAEVLARGPQESEFFHQTGQLLYRARALSRPENGKLRVQLRIDAEDFVHRDTLDLYSYRSRKTLANRVSERGGGAPEEIEEHLDTLTAGLEQRFALLEEEQDRPQRPTMTPVEREEALAFLQHPDLVKILLEDMESLGYVGEEEAKLLVYLIAVSRRLKRPLSGIIQSGAGAGKSFLAELAEQLTPPEEVELFSKLSPQALYYLPKDYLKRKLLILEERAGGEGADYAIRTLQSKDKLTQAVVLKDAATGKMQTRQFEVEGPIAYLETTTDAFLNPENTSRCFEIPLDESIAQTQRIHQHQRRARSLTGLKTKVGLSGLQRKHHNAQRLLEKIWVVIPYSEKLIFPDRLLRTRRDHERFLSLIEAAAFLHQHQRPRKTATLDGQTTTYIEATVQDYALAYRLALRVLWVSLDELSRWSRELVDWMRQQTDLAAEDKIKPTDVRWTRRQLRESLRWPDRRLRESLNELVELEYLQTLRGSQGQAYLYRLNPYFQNSPQALGLLTPEQLKEKL